MKIAISMCTGKTAYHINQAYVDYVVAAGHTPIAIFPTENAQEAAPEMAAMCDGLLLPGGIDIDPVYYGEDNFTSYNIDPDKDNFERGLLYAFTELGKPVFGICRGYQLIARELLQHAVATKRLDCIGYMQSITGHKTNSAVDAARSTKTHSVLANVDRLYKNAWHNKSRRFERVFVNSMHHQGLVVNKTDVLQEGKDGTSLFDVFDSMRVLALTRFGVNAASVKPQEVVYVVEAFEAEFGESVVRGVQWHPEELMDVELFNGYFNNYYEKNGTKEKKAGGSDGQQE